MKCPKSYWDLQKSFVSWKFSLFPKPPVFAGFIAKTPADALSAQYDLTFHCNWQSKVHHT